MNSGEAAENGLFETDVINSSTFDQAKGSASYNPTTKVLSYSQFYLYPNRFEEVVQASGGSWFPIRDACTPSGAQLAGGVAVTAG